MRTRPFVFCLIVVSLAACAPEQPAPLDTPTPEAVLQTATPAAGEDICQVAFADYASWARVNPAPISGHETCVDIYVNDLAGPVYLAAGGDAFPECSAIVRTHLAGPALDTVTAVTVMIKMPAGYDPAHSDWWWGMYGPDATTELMSGRVEVCIPCHQKAADADYVFSTEVLAKSGE